MNGLSTAEPRRDASTRSAVAETIAAVALGMFGVALMSGRAVFAGVVALSVLAILLTPRLRQVARRLREALASPMVLGTVMVLVAWLPSTILSEMPWESVQVHIRMVVFLMMGALIYAHFVDHQAKLDLVFRTMLISLAYGLTVAIVAMTLYPLATYLIQARGLDHQHHAVLLFKAASSSAILIFPLTGLVALRLRGWWRLLSLAAAVGLVVVVYMSESRSGLAGLVGGIGLVVFALLLRRETRRWGIWGLLGFAAVVGLIATYLLYRDVSILVPEESLPLPAWLIDPHRQLIWSFGLELVAQRIWFGSGINTINLIPASIDAPMILPVINVMPGHPHNWVIEVFAETGVIGGVPMVIAVVALFILLLRRYHATGDPRFVALLSASGGFWVSSLFNFSFWSAWWQVSYIVVVSLICACRSRTTGGEIP